MPQNDFFVQYDEAALRDLKKLEKDVAKKIVDKAGSLAKDPRPAGVERLTGYPDYYRVRVGNYRIVYTIIDEQLLVVVVAAGDRKSIYDLIKRRLG